MRITSYFRTWRNRTTLGKQLSRVLNLLLFLLLIPLLLYFQTAQSRVNLAHEAASVKRVLALEAVRLEDYIAELGDYSLQLRNDSGFMGLLSREGELDYARQRTVESALRMLFYSRDDIEWMELYLLKSRAAFRIESDRRKVLPLAYLPPEALDDHDAFIAAPDYVSIQPEAAGFVRVTRTIIDSPRTTPLAVVRFLADSSIPDAMARSHGENGEQLYLFSPDGVSLTRNGEEAEVLSALNAGETALGGRRDRRMLAGFRARTGLTLAVLKPIALIDAALGHYSAVTTVLVALVLGLGLLLSEVAIRLFTRPVRDLARRMQDVGKGDLRAKDDMRGDGQLGLSAEANHMLAGISVLMDRSHVSELNARAARLAALEAQTNPHFLFNTLQAIATEAILAGDDKVYRMVTALAALMRYTIKGGNLVKLSTELEIVEKYLRLQKSRFGERRLRRGRPAQGRRSAQAGAAGAGGKLGGARHGRRGGGRTPGHWLPRGGRLRRDPRGGRRRGHLAGAHGRDPRDAGPGRRGGHPEHRPGQPGDAAEASVRRGGAGRDRERTRPRAQDRGQDDHTHGGASKCARC